MGKKLEDYTCDQLYNRLFHFLFCGKGKAFQQRVLMSIFFLHPCCWLLNVIGWSWHWIHVYLFFLMCYVKFVYSEAILINYPNSMKLEFLQGDARLHLKFIYNLLWWRSCCLQKPWCSWTDSYCVVTWSSLLRGSPIQNIPWYISTIFSSSICQWTFRSFP